MTMLVYNVSLAVALALVAVGVGLWSVPAALVVTGGLILLLTLFGAYMRRGR